VVCCQCSASSFPSPAAAPPPPAAAPPAASPGPAVCVCVCVCARARVPPAASPGPAAARVRESGRGVGECARARASRRAYGGRRDRASARVEAGLLRCARIHTHTNTHTHTHTPGSLLKRTEKTTRARAHTRTHSWARLWSIQLVRRWRWVMLCWRAGGPWRVDNHTHPHTHKHTDTRTLARRQWPRTALLGAQCDTKITLYIYIRGPSRVDSGRA
jgi:hypothetical protein